MRWSIILTLFLMLWIGFLLGLAFFLIRWLLYKGTEKYRQQGGGEANVRRSLGEALRERGILIRDCSNFAGLTGGWFRCAIRKPEENDRLLDMLREVITVG